ncbi:hypothetical protein BpHYR1_046897, partial [Brachionus plicatilis]
RAYFSVNNVENNIVSNDFFSLICKNHQRYLFQMPAPQFLCNVYLLFFAFIYENSKRNKILKILPVLYPNYRSIGTTNNFIIYSVSSHYVQGATIGDLSCRTPPQASLAFYFIKRIAVKKKLAEIFKIQNQNI